MLSRHYCSEEGVTWWHLCDLWRSTYDTITTTSWNETTKWNLRSENWDSAQDTDWQRWEFCWREIYFCLLRLKIDFLSFETQSNVKAILFWKAVQLKYQGWPIKKNQFNNVKMSIVNWCEMWTMWTCKKCLRTKRKINQSWGNFVTHLLKLFIKSKFLPRWQFMTC